MSEFSNEYGTHDVYSANYGEQNKTRSWSVAALVLSIVSILCCCVYWLGLFTGIFAVVCAIVSRRKLGYFDGLSVGAIIVAIFGIVFSAVTTYVNLVLLTDPEIMEMINEILREQGLEYPLVV